MCVRTEHGVRLIEVPTVVPSTTRATFCGLTSVREILGRSARVAPASPIPTTKNRYAAATCLRPPLLPFGFTGFSSNGRSDRLEVVRTRFPCEGIFPIRVELNGYPIQVNTQAESRKKTFKIIQQF